MLTKGKESEFVRDQAVEALNFHITMPIATFASFILIFVVIGFSLVAAVMICGVVFTIIAAIAANLGVAFRYTMNLHTVQCRLAPVSAGLCARRPRLQLPLEVPAGALSLALAL